MNPSRREVLQAVGAGCVVLVLTQLGCGDDEESCDNGTGGRSSEVDGHTHFICIPGQDISVAPAGGRGYESSSSDGHRHQLLLNPLDFQALNEGQQRTFVSSLDDGHSHTFTLQRA